MRYDARKYQAFEHITADPVMITCGSAGKMFKGNSQQPPVALTVQGEAAVNHKSTERGSNSDVCEVRVNNTKFSTFQSICRLPFMMYAV